MSIAIHHPAFGRARGWAERRALRVRRDLAAGFERALADAERPSAGLSARIPVDREQVLCAASDLRRLVAVLRDETRVVSAEGVAQARDLICDGHGPVYCPAEPATLRRRVRVILAELE